ncbi:MAG TPA: antibiotic biosynthesis monooxygenase family protein, partial [Thermomicrobiales bacterium]|nr:antibiotic biosynthesis monooxygenase family protein [Thermomicrobiales bacterium]
RLLDSSTPRLIQAGGQTMLVVVAEYTVKAGNEARVAALLQRWAPMAREEPGCANFIVNQSVDDPRQILLYEQYVDDDAFAAHAARPEFKEIILDQVVPLLENRGRRLYQVIG